MCGNSANGAIVLLDSPDQQPAKTVQTEAGFVNAARASSHDAGKLPFQKDPGIGQDQTDAQQEEPHGRVARSGGGPHPSEQSITTFHAKASAIILVNLVGGPVQQDDDKRQPFAATFACFVRYQRGFHRDRGLGPVAESIARGVAFAPATQRPGPTGFATNRIGDDGGLLEVGQVRHNRGGGEPFVQIQHFALKTKVFQALQQDFEHFQRFFTG